MTEKEMVAAYLKRIGVKGRPAPTVKNLFMLQKAHMLHIPYEDLEIWRGKAGSLAIAEVFEKIVVKGRGGYCFELNGLFAWLLKQLGYTVVEHFGRWLMGESLAIPARRHRVIRVMFPKATYIADVGVGQRAPLEPLELDGEAQLCEGLRYRIVPDARLGHVQEVALKGVWTRVYSFDDAAQEPIDFNYVHWYCVNHPQSFFHANLLVHMPTLEGRRSIGSAQDPETGETVPLLSVSGKDGKTTRTYLRTPAALAAALKKHFGIVER